MIPPAALCYSSLGMLASGDMVISWGYIVAYVLVYLFTTTLTWVVASRITTAVLREQNIQQKESMDKLSTDFAALATAFDAMKDSLATVRQERTECELMASKQFATREELAQLMVASSSSNRQMITAFGKLQDTVRNSIASVHRRVDELSERTTRVETLQKVTKGKP